MAARWRRSRTQEARGSVAARASERRASDEAGPSLDVAHQRRTRGGRPYLDTAPFSWVRSLTPRRRPGCHGTWAGFRAAARRRVFIKFCVIHTASTDCICPLFGHVPTSCVSVCCVRGGVGVSRKILFLLRRTEFTFVRRAASQGSRRTVDPRGRAPIGRAAHSHPPRDGPVGAACSASAAAGPRRKSRLRRLASCTQPPKQEQERLSASCCPAPQALLRPPCSSSTGCGTCSTAWVRRRPLLAQTGRAQTRQRAAECRPRAQERKDPLPRVGQCWEDDAAAHAQGRAPLAAQPHPAPECALPRRRHALPRPPLTEPASARAAASEELSIAKIKFRTFDLGGHEIARCAAPRRLRPPACTHSRSLIHRARGWQARVEGLLSASGCDCLPRGRTRPRCGARPWLRLPSPPAHSRAARGPCNHAERFCESKKELDQLLSCEELHDVPFLILGNKIDLGRAASEARLTDTRASPTHPRPSLRARGRAAPWHAPPPAWKYGGGGGFMSQLGRAAGGARPAPPDDRQGQGALPPTRAPDRRSSGLSPSARPRARLR